MKKKQKIKVVVDGKEVIYDSVLTASKELGVCPSSIRYRLENGGLMNTRLGEVKVEEIE